MKMYLVLLAFLFGFGLETITAQNETEGFLKLNQKNYVEARQIFSAILKTNPDDAPALFGMGEYFYYTGKPDSAKICYLNGIHAKSSYASNYAGLGKVNLTAAPGEAESNFKEAVKKSKKDANALVCISQAYFDQSPKNLDKAKYYIDLAIGIDSKNAQAHYLDGLIDLEQNNSSTASLQFDQAIYFDPNLFDAYFYQSQIMESAKNFGKALNYINRVIEIKPDYWPAYKRLGELNYNNQKYADAVTNFGTYFKNVKDDKDITHYAYSLFFNKQYTDALALIDNLVKQNPNDYVLLRLMGYINYETKDLASGKTYFDRFFTVVPPDKILSDDYLYYGKMLSAVGNDSLAIETYKQVLKKDSTQFQVYDEMAKSSLKMKKYDQSLQYGSEFLKKKPNPLVSDFFQLGKAYYVAADGLDVKTDSLKQLNYLHAADSLFTKVETLASNSYLGTFWRARVNSAIDKETTLGLAKPFYEKAMETLLKDPVKYQKELEEIYAYLGFYYYLKEDKPNSLDYWKKLLEIDPENPKALEAIKALDKK